MFSIIFRLLEALFAVYIILERIHHFPIIALDPIVLLPRVYFMSYKLTRQSPDLFPLYLKSLQCKKSLHHMISGISPLWLNYIVLLRRFFFLNYI